MNTIARKTKKISTTVKIFVICFAIYFIANVNK